MGYFSVSPDLSFLSSFKQIKQNMGTVRHREKSRVVSTIPVRVRGQDSDGEGLSFDI